MKCWQESKTKYTKNDLQCISEIKIKIKPELEFYLLGNNMFGIIVGVSLFWEKFTSRNEKNIIEKRPRIDPGRSSMLKRYKGEKKSFLLLWGKRKTRSSQRQKQQKGPGIRGWIGGTSMADPG